MCEDGFGFISGVSKQTNRQQKAINSKFSIFDFLSLREKEKKILWVREEST